MNNLKKENKQEPMNFLWSLLVACMFLFSAASCNSGGGEGAVEDEGLAETEEIGYDTELGETESELVTNDAVGRFDEWDINDDQMLDQNEFETVANDAGFYNEWDADADGFLSDDELNEGIYGVYDEDDDGVFSEDEFNNWNTAWGGDYEYDAWDVNNDNVLDNDEFYTGIGDAGIYEGWDVDNDGLYADEEVYGGLFETWDADDDDYLATEEYNTIGYNLWGF